MIINLNENDNFHCLRGIDLQELLKQINDYSLEYRNILNLPQDITFGVEIEYENILKTPVDNFIKKQLPTWKSKIDASLTLGGEINSPIMKDDFKYWEELKTICQYLNEKDADTFHNAGGHIHLGAHLLGKDVNVWKAFLKLYTAYEGVLFRFLYGDKINARKKILKYASPISKWLYNELENINLAHNVYNIGYIIQKQDERREAVNFDNVWFSPIYDSEIKNTLEFRAPNSSTKEIIWQNNINTLAKMLLSAVQDVMDIDFLDYKLAHEFSSYQDNKYMYSEVTLKNALEFIDLIFDNNLDKIYFLKQYLKNFQTNYEVDEAVKAEDFINAKIKKL